MREKEGVISSELSGFNGVVFDGYANPVETLSHSFVCSRYGLNCIDVVTNAQTEILITATSMMYRLKEQEWSPSWDFF
ncbi:MAG: hypothetical protein LBH92_06200 [Bacteroidales bacterium]|jgi:hypothetical protein|nr:hypothetical protein [Bacteroidales bacterium]